MGNRCGFISVFFLCLGMCACGRTNAKHSDFQTPKDVASFRLENEADFVNEAETSESVRREPVQLSVTKHKQEGRHMVRAGKLTLSVPTTFDGLEREGAHFMGDKDLVRANETGSCRVRYRGGYGNIRIHVINNTDDTMVVRDCTVKGVEIASREADPELTLYGIPMGATRHQVAAVYGEPFSKTFDDEKGMSNMVYQFGTDIYSKQIVMILFENGRAVSASYDDFAQTVR